MAVTEALTQNGLIATEWYVAPAQVEIPLHPFAATMKQAFEKVKEKPLTKQDLIRAQQRVTDMVATHNPHADDAIAVDEKIIEMYAALRIYQPPQKQKDPYEDPYKEDDTDLKVSQLADEQLFALILGTLGRKKDLIQFKELHSFIFNPDRAKEFSGNPIHVKQARLVEESLTYTLNALLNVEEPNQTQQMSSESKPV